MAKRPISLLLKGLYWTLALAVALPALPGLAAQHDLLAEWELVTRAATEARRNLKEENLKTQKHTQKREAILRHIAELAVRSTAGAERALAIGDASMFESYRRQFREQFRDMRWRIGRVAGWGNAAAEYALGVIALHGFLEPPALEAACRHFGAALAKGYAGSKFRVSQCLEKENPARAETLMREAADSSHPAAAELLGRACLEAKPPQADCAFERLTAAAAAGRPSAQSALAWMYAQGVGGRHDPAHAARLYLQAARAGDAPAQNNAGELYETGRGVEPDPKLALDWYRKAAEAGFAPGQFNLGRIYAAGTGVPRDFVEARKWLEQAERGGVANARQLIEWMEREIPGK
jgi:TPR repeat protein